MAPKITNMDTRIGKNLNKRRRELGLRQEDIADCIGVTHQQVQKYESGKDRIPASRLLQAALMLGVEIDYFFNKKAIEENKEDRRVFNLAKNFRLIDNEIAKETIESTIRAFANKA